MRSLRHVLAALIAATLFAPAVRAADRAGSVSATTLGSMGFGTAQVMTDAEGAAVRGRGYFAFAKTVVQVNAIKIVRVDVAPPGHFAYTQANWTSGALFAGGSAFAYAK